MKKKRSMTVRAAVLSLLAVSLAASLTVFLAVNAAGEDNVTPSDQTVVDSVGGQATQEAPENLDDPVITLTTMRNVGDELGIGITGENVYVDYGDGVPVAYAADGTVLDGTIRIYADSLTGLNCAGCGLTALDVSRCTGLRTLDCHFNSLASLDVSGCPELRSLSVYLNDLTSLDISACPELENLDCHQNRLTALVLPDHANTIDIQAYDNRLTFSGLSGNLANKQIRFNDQEEMTIPEKVDIGGSVDLSSEYTFMGETSTFTWYDAQDNEVTPVSSEGGVFTFGPECAGLTLHCVITTPAFESRVPLDGQTGFGRAPASLRTTGISVNAVVGTPAVTLHIVGWATLKYVPDVRIVGQNLMVDYGDGAPAAYTGTHTPVGRTIRIYGDHITSLDCSDMRLDSIQLSNVPELQTLICYGNGPLCDKFELDLSHVPALTYLDCHDCNIYSLDLSQNPMLAHFDCNTNSLTKLDLSRNTNLEYLNCGCNMLTKLDLSRNTKLTALDCGGNRMGSKLDLSHNTLLTVLDCGDNHLSALALPRSDSLRDIACDYNRITSIDCTPVPELVSLDCSHNRVSRLNIVPATHLEVLNCGYNSMRSLVITSANSALRELDCSEIWLYKLDLSEAVNLEKLICMNNLLYTLDVSHNTALTVLDCSAVQAKSFDFSHNTELRELRCGGNELTTLDVSHNTKLTLLECSYCTLTSIDVSMLPDLENLYCYDNKLTYIDLSQNHAIKEISCQRNKLTGLFVPDDANVKWFHASDNPFVLSQVHIPGSTFLIDISPLKPMDIPFAADIGEAVDLSSEYSFCGCVSEMTWYDSDGAEVTPTTSEGGVFTFGEEFTGKKLHCRISNENLREWAYDYVHSQNITVPVVQTTTEIMIAVRHTLKAGESLDLNTLFTRPEGMTGSFTWTSSNSKAATVDRNGVLKAVAAGITVVTAKRGSYSVVFAVEVEKAVALNKYTLSFTRTTNKRAPYTSLTAKKPSGVKNVVWTSDNPAVATVDARGRVTAVGAGSASITCDDVNGGSVSAPCVVTVEDFIITTDSENIFDTNAYLLEGESCRFSMPNENHGAVTWKSGNAKVASVDTQGNISGLKKGTVTITAQAADKKASDSVRLTVVQPTETLSVNGAPAVMYVGGKATLKPVLSRGSNDPVFWTSADASVATVDAKGVVKGVSQGKTTVTAVTFSGRSVTVDVTVRTKAVALRWTTVPQNMTVSQEIRQGIAVGEELALRFEITSPEGCNDTVSWTTSNKKIITLTPAQDGKSARVTGNLKGTAVVTVKTGSGKKLSARITVVETPASQIVLNKREVSLYIGASASLSAKTLPKGNNDVVIWKSSDPSVATVDESGKVRAVSQGVATITAYSSRSGDVRDEATVTVRAKATAVDTDFSAAVVQAGSTVDLHAVLSPDGCNDTVTWSTSNRAVATVAPSADGRTCTVTGIKKGTVTVTVRTGSGKTKKIRVSVTEG